MSNNLPSARDIALARLKLETAVAMAWGLYYLEDISTPGADVLRRTFVEQMQQAAVMLGLELVERQTAPLGPGRPVPPHGSGP